jgi:hypothetical protein
MNTNVGPIVIKLTDCTFQSIIFWFIPEVVEDGPSFLQVLPVYDSAAEGHFISASYF